MKIKSPVRNINYALTFSRETKASCIIPAGGAVLRPPLPPQQPLSPVPPLQTASALYINNEHDIAHVQQRAGDHLHIQPFCAASCSSVCGTSKLMDTRVFPPVNLLVSTPAVNSHDVLHILQRRSFHVQLYAQRTSNYFLPFIYSHGHLSPPPEARVSASSSAAVQTKCSSDGREAASSRRRWRDERPAWR